MSIRRLIVCFDGTWNTPDQKGNVTNVVKILRSIRAKAGDVSQVVFYDKGVGTGNLLDRIAGGASGAGLDKNMIDGYRFLANNYSDEDEIYIFGFSRGAYTARALVGLISLAGLLMPRYLGKNLQDAIDIYRDKDLSFAQKKTTINAITNNHSADVRIRCVGVWDTVGSLGIPGDLGRRLLEKKYHFSSSELSAKVDVALHAVAIDEKRSAFAPTLWVRPENSPPSTKQIIEQVWFPGVHSNVGGSYEDAGLSDTALDWMVKRVHQHTDLEFDQEFLEQNVKPDALGNIVESRSGMYKTSVIYPYQRVINQIVPEGKGFGEWFRKTFPKYDRRYSPPEGFCPVNEMLHISALERWGKSCINDCSEEDQSCPETVYRPVNLDAVLAASDREKIIPVVDWDGNILPPEDVRWPEVRLQSHEWSSVGV